MIRIFELPDIHFDIRWADVIENAITSVEKEAEDNPPDLITAPGDLHNKPLYAADRSGYSRLLEIVRRLLAIAPVAAIEGTPSHDAPGAYSPLEELGLVLLKPGRVYRLYPGEIVDAALIPPQNVSPLAVLFGIPELDKDGAAALSSEFRAGETLGAFDNYIDEFIAPHRESFPELPAVALLHGVISDSRKENETDIVKRSSSLLIHTEDLERAGIDRWVLGDIHTPWESERISAGYAGFTGMDDNPWGKTGFIPAFNSTTIVGGDVVNLDGLTGEHKFSSTVRRVPYGTPKRVKISEPLAAYSPTVAYWLDSKVDDTSLDPAKNGAHPWSRITFEVKKEKTRRVSKEEAEKAAGAGDLLALMVPGEATEERRAMADAVDASASTRKEDRWVELISVKVAGSTFFKERTVELDISKLQPGLTAITGDNGEGKSGLFSFCSPYPVVVGKDTESGRVSAIKEFFSAQESFIEKNLMFNTDFHRHLITIKGAHTKSPKTECYLYVNGINILETTNFDAMLSKCEELYGPLDDYLRTYQYVQPQQGGAPSGLMSAGSTDLRNVVQNIGGIDRSAERRISLDRAADNERSALKMVSLIEGKEGTTEDPDEIKAGIEALEHSKIQTEIKLKKTEADLDAARTEERDADAANRKAIEVAEALVEHRRLLQEARVELAESAERFRSFEEAVSSSASARAAISEDDAAQKLLGDWKESDDERKIQNGESLTKFASAQAAHSEERRRAEEIRNDNKDRAAKYDSDRLAIATSVEAAELVAKSAYGLAKVLAKPCEACGHISSENQVRVDEKRAEGEAAEKRAAVFLLALKELDLPTIHPVPEVGPAPVPPTLLEGKRKPDVSRLSDEDRKVFFETIKKSNEASVILPEIKKEVDRKSEVYHKFVDGLENFKDDRDDTAARFKRAEIQRVECEHVWRALTKEIENGEARISMQREALEKAEEVLGEIEQDREQLEAFREEAENWKWLAAMFAPAKLPAFELELVLDSIDARATKNIAPFREGRYEIRTETQREGADGRVDKFQIVIYDREEGTERSFLKHSPGEKAFAALAYQRALIAVREERSGVTYSPYVLDEADGPVQPARVPEYYAMQSETVGEGKALVVSHAPDAQHYIENHVAIEELKQ